MSSMKPTRNPAMQEFVEGATPPHCEAIADVDGEIVNAHWRWLHARWEEDAEGLVQATVAIDILLDRRIQIMHAQEAEAA
jgi:hypothetical protein